MRGDRDRIRLAVEALAQVRADAWARGDRPQGVRGADSSPPLAGGVWGGSVPPRRRRDDPQLFVAAMGGLLSARGWRQRAAMGTVFGEWERIVGTELAAHTKPEQFNDGELTISADSPAWATQVRLLASDLLRRLGAELGHGTVRTVRVTAPGARPRKPAWRPRR